MKRRLLSLAAEPPATLRRVGLVIGPIVLVLLLTYIAFEVRTLSASESALAEVYEHQVETLLSSVNQHAWDVTALWANEIDRSLTVADAAYREDRLSTFVEGQQGLLGVFLCDASFRQGALYLKGAPKGPVGPSVLGNLQLRRVAEQLGRTRASGYRKIIPVWMQQEAEGARVALLFTPWPLDPSARVAGLLLDEDEFIRQVLIPKLREVSRGTITVALARRDQEGFTFSTGPMDYDRTIRQRAVWVLPDYVIAVRSRNLEIERIVKGRFYRSLLLIGLIAATLGIGTWQIFRYAQQAVRLARVRSDFVSNVSHELRTPLALIRMYAESLELGRVPSEPRRAEYYRIIRSEAERLSRLVNNILNFSRLDAGKKQYAAEPVYLNDLVEKVLQAYRQSLERQGASVHTRLSEDEPALRGDLEALEECLINLIDNAAKYSPERKAVTIRTGMVSAAEVYLEVEDEGPGIPPSEQQRIFDQFYRVDSALVHNTKGSGLGLAIVKRTVEAHGGAVTLRSKMGAGSCFRLSFPILTPVPAPILLQPTPAS